MRAALRTILLHRPVAWTPLSLGTDLIEWFDAEQAGTLSLSGGLVSSITGVLGTAVLSQSSAGSKPAYSATGITADSVDDSLDLATGVPASWPINADPVWIWALAAQNDLVADATTGYLFGYGDTGSSGQRRLARIVATGVNRARVSINGGSNPTDATADFSGRHLVLVKVGATATTISIDSDTPTSAAVVPATTNVWGASLFRSPNASNFGGFTLNTLLLTLPLSGANETLLTTYLNARNT